MKHRNVLPWIQTYTGKKLWLNTPMFDQICIEDIVHALSNICRFTGHAKRFYSVAEHSFHASFLVPKRLQLAALMHDASEAYLGDISKPLKDFMGGKYAELESMFSNRIEIKFDCGLLEKDKPTIKTADEMMLRAEAMQALHNFPIENWHLGLPKNNNIKLRFWEPEIMHDIFMNRFDQLINNIYLECNDY